MLRDAEKSNNPLGEINSLWKFVYHVCRSRIRHNLSQYQPGYLHIFDHNQNIYRMPLNVIFPIRLSSYLCFGLYHGIILQAKIIQQTVDINSRSHSKK